MRNSFAHAFVSIFPAPIAFTVPLGGQISFDGCRDIQGIPVASIRDVNVNDIAIATLDGAVLPFISTQS